MSAKTRIALAAVAAAFSLSILWLTRALSRAGGPSGTPQDRPDEPKMPVIPWMPALPSAGDRKSGQVAHPSFLSFQIPGNLSCVEWL